MRCLVCRSSFRTYYEELRGKGYNVPKIYNECVKIGEKFSIQSLYRHFANHYNPKGINVIPKELASHIVISIFKNYVDEYNIRRIMPILHKYLSKPYWKSKKELYRDIKKCVKELDIMNVDSLNKIWKQAINEPLYFNPFNNQSFNEYFKK